MHRSAYLESEVLSASPLQLVELLYRGAVDAANQAFLAARSGQTLERNRQVNRAHAILVELSLSLNHSVGGSLSKDLAEIYDYLQRRLTQANFEQNAELLAEVRTVLTGLLESWQTVVSESVPSARRDMGLYENARQFANIDGESSRINSLG